MADAMFQDFKRQIAERRAPKGWRCLRCHPPNHLPAEAIRREGEADMVPIAAPQGADPLFRQVGIDLDEG